jgi:hypothetical protein
VRCRPSFICLLLAISALAQLGAQEAFLVPAPKVHMPAPTDGNCPSFWWQGSYRLFTSIGRPLQLSVWQDDAQAWETSDVGVNTLTDLAIWVESVWVDEEDGTVFAWYHHEPGEMYPDSGLTAPKIGAVISFDGGRTIHDLGFILETGDALEADARNGCFAGGHGDFSVVLDRNREYFYFFFTNYNGPDESQGIVAARMAYRDRHQPVGRVFKYHNGGWNEPGRGGRMTPLFPAARAWRHADPDSLWGPAVHWNTYLQRYVMVFNRTQGDPGWVQEGIYLSYGSDLAQPESWTPPARIMDPDGFPSWGTFYPQVIGLEPGDSDSQAGGIARFYVSGASRWEIVFIHGDGWMPPTRRPH